MINALLVDDENLLLEAIEIILTLSNINVFGKANDGNEALKLLKEKDKKCDIALVDLNMKGMGGIELIKNLKEMYPEIKILVLTTFYDDENITSAISEGADGYLLKDSGKEAIIGAINQIMGGTTVLDQKVMMSLSRIMNNKNNIDNKDTKEELTIGVYDVLTKREEEICSLIVKGLSNKQIADTLYISEGTVKNYISNIYDKTGIHDRVKLIVELGK